MSEPDDRPSADQAADTHLRRALCWARLLTVSRDEGIEGYQETVRLLLTLSAISPHIRPTFDAASGRLGRPSEQWDPPPPPRLSARRRRALSRMPEQCTASPSRLQKYVRPSECSSRAAGQ